HGPGKLGARIAQVFVRELIPRVEARRDDHGLSAGVEDAERRRRPVLTAIDERTEPPTLPRLDLEEMEVAHRALHEAIVQPVKRVVVRMRRDSPDPRPALRLRLEEQAEFRSLISATWEVPDLRVEVFPGAEKPPRPFPDVVGVVVEQAAGMAGARRAGARGTAGFAGDVRRVGGREEREHL